MDKLLEKYIDEKYPWIKIEYKRSKEQFEDIMVNDKVLTLKRGYGGGPGLILRVDELYLGNDKYGTAGKCLVLSNKNDGEIYLVYKKYKNEFWWESIYVLKEEDLEILRVRDEREEWQIKNLGRIIF